MEKIKFKYYNWLFYIILLILLFLLINTFLMKDNQSEAATIRVSVYTQNTSGNYVLSSAGVSRVRIQCIGEGMSTAVGDITPPATSCEISLRSNLMICMYSCNINQGFSGATGGSLYEGNATSSFSGRIDISRNQYTANFYTVIDGVNTLLSSSQYYYQANFSLPSAPSYTGYSFDGWYTAASGGSLVTSGTMSLNGVNYYAHYSKLQYNVTLDNQNATTSGTTSIVATYGQSMPTITPPTKNYYTFSGYYSGLNGTGNQYYNSSGNSTRNYDVYSGITLYAYWVENLISATLHFQDNSTSDIMVSVAYNQSGSYLNLTSPTRSGYTFNGWNLNQDGTGRVYSTSTNFNNINEVEDQHCLSTPNAGNISFDLYAQWETNQLIATLKYLNGTSDGRASAEYVSSATKLGLPELSRTGYEFKGWSLTPNNTGVYYDADTNWNNVSVSVDNKDVCISDVNVGDIYFNLYAIWEANEYKINYNLAGGSHGSSHPTTATYRDKYDENSGENDNIINISNPTKKGYTFTGWTASGLSNTAQAGGASWNGTATTATAFKNLTAKDAEDGGTVTLTANWTANTYTIAFNGNGSTGGSTSSMKATYDSAVTLTANGFIKAGYVFTGWNTKSDGSGKSYSDKETVKNLTSVDGATVTLYAQWEETWANNASSSLKTTQINGVTYNVIASAEDLAYLSKQSISSTLLGKYIQTADIDLSDYTWLPIGSENAFCGEYLGQGHKITGLKTCDAVDADDVYLQTYGGLFGKLGKNSTNGASANIVGVFITDCLVYGQYSGAIAGLSDDESVNIDSVNIEACILENIEIYGNTTASFVGSSSDGQIKDCLLISSNISTANTTTRGFYTGSMTIKSCYFVENNSATRFTGESSDYSNWIEDVFIYPMPSIVIWYPNENDF